MGNSPTPSGEEKFALFQNLYRTFDQIIAARSTKNWQYIGWTLQFPIYYCLTCFLSYEEITITIKCSE